MLATDDRDGTHNLLEAEILKLSEDGTERNDQLAKALKVNLGLLLDCEAAIHMSRTKDGAFLVARAIHSYTVTSIGKLMRAIEDVTGLVDLVGTSAPPVEPGVAEQFAHTDGSTLSFSRSTVRHR